MLIRGERELPFESLKPLCLCTITILVAVLPIGSTPLLADGLDAFSSSFLMGESGLPGFSFYLTCDSLIARLPDCTEENVDDFF